jgi:hypothetical protein
MGTIVALSVLVPSASAASHKAFLVTKTCSDNYTCTVQTSSFKDIPQYTVITYVDVLPDSSVQEATVTIKNGSATGVCDFREPDPGTFGTCEFGSGTGRLTQFHLSVVVTGDENGAYSWTGWYWYGNDH